MDQRGAIIDLSDSRRIVDSIHWSSQINQNYHPAGFFPQDSFSIVYSSENLNSTKFVPILLKEWFFLVKKDGYLVIDYRPNPICDWRVLENSMNWLWEKGYEIVFHGLLGKELPHVLSSKNITDFIQTQETQLCSNLNKETLVSPPLPTDVASSLGDRYVRFVCKKIRNTTLERDNIDKWTFGIVTNGKRIDWLEKIIDSISRQAIPNYEIIICGTCPSSVLRNPKISYLPFNRRDDLGWITYKKNLIVDKARYENMCVIHDRILFSDGWYEGMRKWGNCFEHMSCKVVFNGRRDESDWPCIDLIIEKNKKKRLFTSSLDYQDWHKDCFVGGSIHIGKRAFFVQHPWPLNIYWNEGEDFFVSKRLSGSGHIPRFNIHSEVTALSARFSVLPKIKFTPFSSWKKLDRFSLKRYVLRIVAIAFRLGNGNSLNDL